jgi:hypothetical protein
MEAQVWAVHAKRKHEEKLVSLNFKVHLRDEPKKKARFSNDRFGIKRLIPKLG